MAYVSASSFNGRQALGFACAAALAWVLILSDRNYSDMSSAARVKLSEWVVFPMRVLAGLPAEAWNVTSAYFISRAEFDEAQHKLRESLLRARSEQARLAYISHENARLRNLLELRLRSRPEPLVAEVVNTASLPFSNRIVLSKGRSQGIQPAQGVYNDRGVIGRLSRVDADTSQALMLTDKNFWVAARVRRNGMLVLLQGSGSGHMRLRFVPADTDIKSGDILVTDGGGGTFPAGLPVSKVQKVWHPSAEAFLEGEAVPVASVRQESVLLVTNCLPVWNRTSVRLAEKARHPPYLCPKRCDDLPVRQPACR